MLGRGLALIPFQVLHLHKFKHHSRLQTGEPPFHKGEVVRCRPKNQMRMLMGCLKMK